MTSDTGDPEKASDTGNEDAQEDEIERKRERGKQEAGTSCSADELQQTSDAAPRKRQLSDSKARLASSSGVRPSLSDKAAINALDRMALAHAITLDESFEVKQPSYPQGTMEAQVEATVRKAFWDSFRGRIEAVPPDYSQFLACILEAKEALLSFLPAPAVNSPLNNNNAEKVTNKTAHHDLRERIERELSRSWLERQIASNAIDLSHYADMLLRFMAELCAPFRDEELERARSQNDVVEKYRSIFETLDHMKIDFANFHIRAVRPMLKHMSHEYERGNFETYQKAIATSSSQVEQKDPFNNTVSWLRRAAVRLLEHQQTTSSIEEVGNTSGWIISPTAILFNAFVNLIDEEREPAKASAKRPNEGVAEQYAAYPETLALDFEHLVACRLRFHDLTLLSAVLVTVLNSPGALRYISHENTLFAETVNRRESVRTPPATSEGDSAQNRSSTKQMQLVFIDTLKSEIDLVIHDASSISSSSPENKTSRDLFVLEHVADFLIYRFTRRSDKPAHTKAAKRVRPSADVGDASDLGAAVDSSTATAGDVPDFFDEEDIDLLRAQILSLESSNNAVRKLITSRLRRYFINLLQQLYAVPGATTRPSSANSSSSTSTLTVGDTQQQQNLEHVKIPAGFQPLAVDVERLASVYMRLITHNQATFGKDYARLIRAIGDELGLQRKVPAVTRAAPFDGENEVTNPTVSSPATK